MKVKVSGNVVTIISKIPFDAIASYSAENPLELKTKSGEVKYGVYTDTLGNLTPFGVAFNFKTANGNAALNTVLPPDIAYSSSDIVNIMAEELMALQEYEDAIATLVDTIAEAKKTLEEVVEVE